MVVDTVVVVESMYGFGRPLQILCALALLEGFARGVLARGNRTVETFDVVQDVGVEGEVFSPQWLEKYSGEAPGCTLGRGSYTWRACGLGSNINSEYLEETLVATLNI